MFIGRKKYLLNLQPFRYTGTRVQILLTHYVVLVVTAGTQVNRLQVTVEVNCNRRSTGTLNLYSNSVFVTANVQ